MDFLKKTDEKIGRNDPCPCGSGKKYKQCCLAKNQTGVKKKITAKWLNAPKAPDLMERTFGKAIASTGAVFEASADKSHEKKDHEEQSPDIL